MNRIITLSALALVACNGGAQDTAQPDPSCWYGWADLDGDGYGDPDGRKQLCQGDVDYAEYVSNSLDCHDDDAATSPGAPEVCGGGDEDCDGEVDEGSPLGGEPWFDDDDGDGYGDTLLANYSCEVPEGAVAEGGDCDDGDAAVSPEQDEVCGDGVDNNCDGRADEGFGDVIWMDASMVGNADAGSEEVFSVLGCSVIDEGCPRMTFSHSASASVWSGMSGTEDDGFAAAGTQPADLAWPEQLQALELAGPVAGTLRWTFTPATNYVPDGSLRPIVAIGGTGGGADQGPVTIVADQDLELLGSYDLFDSGGLPAFTGPDLVSGSTDTDAPDGLLIFALAADAEALELDITDDGASPDVHTHALGYAFFAACDAF